jgi:heme exporter protein C
MGNTISKNRQADLWLEILTFVVMAAAIAGVFLIAPTERTMGNVQRIFYFHVASAWVSFLAFFMACLFSIGYLLKRNFQWDHWAMASAEIGLLFCSLVLISGPVWAKQAWGIYWTWDARLTSTLVLWLIYAGYLLLRSMITDPQRRATLAAAVAIFGFANVPIVYFSIRWWRTQHPSPVMMGGEGSGLDSTMRSVFFLSLIAFTLLYSVLLRKRVRLAQLENEAEGLYRQEQVGIKNKNGDREK